MVDVPDDHPRFASLKVRHKIIEGMHNHIVAEAGLIAHGRGEAFDYLLGEKTHEFAHTSIKAAAAQLFLAKHPVLSVNGNVTALCAQNLAHFSNIRGIPIEINLFYRSNKRIRAIATALKQAGAKKILGEDESFQETIAELSSSRRIVDKRGIAMADVVFVPLEDGDRTEALISQGKIVITVDLNPLSRTAQQAHITIVDNITRVFPLLNQEYGAISSQTEAKAILNRYSNTSCLRQSLEVISDHWRGKI